MGMLDGLMDKVTGMLDDTKEVIKAHDRQGWEYLEDSPIHEHELERKLNFYGADRWELVYLKVSSTNPDFTENYRAVFKRPKLEVTDG